MERYPRKTNSGRARRRLGPEVKRGFCSDLSPSKLCEVVSGPLQASVSPYAHVDYETNTRSDVIVSYCA